MRADHPITGLFQGDQDLEIRGDITSAMGLVRPDDGDYDPDKELQSTAFREKLDAGLCDKLFKEFRAKEKSVLSWMGLFPDSKMHTVLLAAMVMQSGAKISDDNMQHLRDIVPRIHSSPGYAWPLNDDGFRDPGKVQFLAALEYYKPGTPRTFEEMRSVDIHGNLVGEYGIRARYTDITDGKLLLLWQDPGRHRQETLSLREMQGGFVLRSCRWIPLRPDSPRGTRRISDSRYTGMPEGPLECSQAVLLRPQEPSHDAQRLDLDKSWQHGRITVRKKSTGEHCKRVIQLYNVIAIKRESFLRLASVVKIISRKSEGIIDCC